MEPEPRKFPQTFFEPEPGAAQILLVRHGQSMTKTEGVPFPLRDGQGDPPLSELGGRQAEWVGKRLGDEPITAVYASTLQRTVQTASPLANRLGLEIRVDPRLREVGLGIGEGGDFRVLAADGHPSIAAMRETREWSAVPGAESNAALTARTVEVINEIAVRHPDELVAVFCHGGVISALMGHAAGTDAFVFLAVRNASVSHLVIKDDAWTIRLFNEAHHNGSLVADRPAG